jgi:hypothetical protein
VSEHPTSAPSRAPEDEDDIGAGWAAYKAARQQKRRENMASSTAELQARGIPFTSHNGGVHLVVAGAWDFWPSTGLWISRQAGPNGKKREGRGVLKLIARIKS